MKLSATLASVLLAAVTAVAQDDGSGDFLEINYDWQGSGKIYLVEGVSNVSIGQSPESSYAFIKLLNY
jgi:hypothetical protein